MLDEFQRDKSKKDGRYPVCKVCRSPLTKSQYAANREQIRARCKVRYDADPEKHRAASKAFQDHLRQTNPEGLRAYHANYYAKHKSQWVVYAKNRDPEKVRRRSFAYREANREKVRACVRDWFRRHPHAPALAANKRRARWASVEDSLTDEQLDEILELFNHRCGYCPVDFEQTLPKNFRTWDHMRPLASEGPNTPDNVIPCCRPCNSRKKDRTMLLMAQYLAA